jgi:hypothetical protein
MVFYVTQGKKSNIGKSYEQLALTDYLLLDWMGKKFRNEGKYPERVKNIETIIEKLNNFVPAIQCKDSGCNNIANYFPVSITIGKYQVQKHGVPETKVGVTDVSIPKDRVYCENHKPIDDKSFSNEELYEIKLDTLVELKKKYPTWQRWVNGIKSVQKVLYDYAGFKGNKTPKKCSDFIYNLPQKSTDFKRPSQVIPDIIKKLEPSDIYEGFKKVFASEIEDPAKDATSNYLDRLSDNDRGYLTERLSKNYGIEKTKKLLGGYYTILKK